MLNSFDFHLENEATTNGIDQHEPSTTVPNDILLEEKPTETISSENNTLAELENNDHSMVMTQNNSEPTFVLQDENSE